MPHSQHHMYKIMIEHDWKCWIFMHDWWRKKAWTRKKTLFFKAMEIRPDFNCLCKQIVFLKIGYHYKFNLTPHCSSNFACLIQFRWNIISHFPLSKFKRWSIPSMRFQVFIQKQFKLFMSNLLQNQASCLFIRDPNQMPLQIILCINRSKL